MIAYFFFDFQTHEKHSFQNFLSSIIIQLLSQNAKLCTIVEELYKTCDSGRSRPTIQDMLVALRRIIDTTATSTYVVIDALDECQDRRSLLEGLKDIQSWNQRDLHVFGTSRQETDIEDTLRPLATDIVSLEESVIDKDILTYVRYQLQHEGKLSRWSEKTREEIETVLVNGANGMFKWVECQLDAIKVCMKLGLLRKALRTLPETLDETYARILASIPQEHVEDARRILLCLVCAFCPLAIEEIAEILAIVVEGDTYYDIEGRLQDPRDILTICSGLVSPADVHRRLGSLQSTTELKGLRLSHFSVKEYLTSDRIAAARLSRFALDERSAHELLAKMCIRYLLWCGQEELFQDPDEWLYFGHSPHRSAFALYAASFWSSHLQAAHLGHSAPLYNECLKMLRWPVLLTYVIGLYEMGLASETTQPIDIPQVHWFGDSGVWDRNRPVRAATPLYYVCMLGLDKLVLKLLAAGEDVNSVGPGSTCLAAAAFFGHRKTVQVLLDNGAEVNLLILFAESEGCKLYAPTAIQLAAVTGGEEIVNMLLAKGADVNICRCQPPSCGCCKDQGPYTALEYAVRNSGSVQIRIVQSLLDAGADVRGYGPGLSAELLYSPIFRGDADLVTLLLNAGVDPNEYDRAESPLVIAIRECKQKCARLLVEHGAQLESIKSRLIQALCEICDSERFLPAIEIALELKPDLKTETLLFAAVKYGQIHATKFMLRNGTTPDYQDRNDVAALHAAVFTPGDDTQLIELLLDANANVNIHGGLFGSALQAAAMSGKAKAVQILLKHGASPDYAGGLYGTALQIAKKRLEDLERSAHDCIWNGYLTDYGPEGYYNWLPKSDCFNWPVRPVERVGGDYVPHFDFPDLPNADYQAIIDALQSHGTGAP